MHEICTEINKNERFCFIKIFELPVFPSFIYFGGPLNEEMERDVVILQFLIFPTEFWILVPFLNQSQYFLVFPNFWIIVSFRKAQSAATCELSVDSQTESNHDTPLTLACQNGHANMVDLLLGRGANKEHRDKKVGILSGNAHVANVT